MQRQRSLPFRSIPPSRWQRWTVSAMPACGALVVVMLAGVTLLAVSLHTSSVLTTANAWYSAYFVSAVHLKLVEQRTITDAGCGMDIWCARRKLEDEVSDSTTGSPAQYSPIPEPPSCGSSWSTRSSLRVVDAFPDYQVDLASPALRELLLSMAHGSPEWATTEISDLAVEWPDIMYTLTLNAPCLPPLPPSSPPLPSLPPSPSPTAPPPVLPPCVPRGWPTLPPPTPSYPTAPPAPVPPPPSPTPPPPPTMPPVPSPPPPSPEPPPAALCGSNWSARSSLRVVDAFPDYQVDLASPALRQLLLSMAHASTEWATTEIGDLAVEWPDIVYTLTLNKAPCLPLLPSPPSPSSALPLPPSHLPLAPGNAIMIFLVSLMMASIAANGLLERWLRSTICSSGQAHPPCFAATVPHARRHGARSGGSSSLNVSFVLLLLLCGLATIVKGSRCSSNPTCPAHAHPSCSSCGSPLVHQRRASRSGDRSSMVLSMGVASGSR